MKAETARRPVFETFLPFVRPHVGEADVAEAVATLRSGWLTTGPKTRDFESAFAEYVGTRHAVGVTSGTAALALALEVAGIGPGDEVITTTLTFVATANAILHRGATPVFADIDPATWNLDPARVAERITPRTRAILPVHFAGRPCAVDALAALAGEHGLALVSDAAHAIEAAAAGRKLATCHDVNAFSFHPVKNLTTGEGGMVATDDDEQARQLRLLRLHGITDDAWSRHAGRLAAPDVVVLGHKCNMTDLQASLGLHQLARLDERHERRCRLWTIYDEGLAGLPGFALPAPVAAGDRHARHLYCVVLDPAEAGIDRDAFRQALREENVGTGHHYRAVHTTTLYRERCPGAGDDLPHAGRIAERIVTLPLYPALTDAEANGVVEAIHRVLGHRT